jgi:polysaccharide biosynthesis protein PslH
MTTATQPSAPADRAAPPRLRVLMLSHRLPYPPDRGDRIRSYHILKLLARHFDLAVACTSDEPVWLQHHQLLMTMAHRVAIQPILPYYSRLRGLGALCTGQAVTPACY